MGVWLPDGWMESAPAGFPLPPLVPPGPPSLPAAEREGGKRVGFGGGEAAAPKPFLFSPSLRRAAAARRGPGGGVSPEGQVASMPVDVLVNFFKFIEIVSISQGREKAKKGLCGGYPLRTTPVSTGERRSENLLTNCACPLPML